MRRQVEYERCEKRIEAKGSGNCAGQYMDYIECVDKCASADLFSSVK
jgi:ubiquinol-cytochrome c reductase subunit 6